MSNHNARWPTGLIGALSGLGLFALFALGFYIYRVFWLNTVNFSLEQWGAIGDYWGGILNPLVAAAALSMLAYSISIQRRELAAATTAMKDSNAALEATLLHQQKALEIEDCRSFIRDHMEKVEYLLKTPIPINHSFTCIDESHNSTLQTNHSLRQVLTFDASKYVESNFIERAKVEFTRPKVKALIQDVDAKIELIAEALSKWIYLHGDNNTCFYAHEFIDSLKDVALSLGKFGYGRTGYNVIFGSKAVDPEQSTFSTSEPFD